MHPAIEYSSLSPRATPLQERGSCSTLFFPHPLPDIGRTVFQPHTTSFATCQELNCPTICQSNVSQVQDDGWRILLEFEESLQFLDMRGLESTAKEENRESLPRRSVNLQGHGVRCSAFLCVSSLL